MLLSALPKPNHPTIPEQRVALLADCRQFFETHGDTLLDALAAVGGTPAVRSAVQLIEAVHAAPAWLTPFTRQLDRLYGILTLEHLDDPFGPFPINMSALDPAGPIAEQCCWHADRLRDFVERAEQIKAKTLAVPRDPRSLLRKPMRN